MRNWNKTARMATLAVAGVVIAMVSLINGCGRSNHPGTGTQSLITGGAAQPLTAINFEPTPERVERGKYLVEGVAHCFQCHSDVDWNTPGAQPRAGRKGVGHNFADADVPFAVAPNITPDKETGAGTWDDETLARAIREGIGHDGRRLFPLMPYMNFRHMSDEDLASVISYIRTIAPVRNELPKTAIPEEMKNSLPPHEPITQPVPGPDMSDPIKRGAYLVTLGNCAFCHTPMDQQGRLLAGLEFAGGGRLQGPWGDVHSANLTPDPSGIPYYDEALFIQTMRTGQVKARKLNSIMPWGYFGKMTDDDLKAIFAYLRTLKPVKHVVDNTEPPTDCKVCGGRHGFGDRN
ncbi:MAG TPA: c-type cytochrome [Blastocatellia bacterium]|jgi:mono/diheme cytochrome c family protein|nr:c-type cytochrome [Blastocatellia bacterium]